MALVTGTDNSETLTGTNADDVIQGKGGDDVVHARAGNDRIFGGTGADSLFGEGGNDTFLVFGGETAANEVYDGGSGLDTLQASNGADFRNSTLTSIEQLKFNSGGATTVSMKAASFGGTGLASNLVIVGSDGIDRLEITMAEKATIDLHLVLYSNWGPEDQIVIFGDSSNELFQGSWGTDFISSFFGVDTVLAGGGDDFINADLTQAGDIYNGGTGFDTLLVFNSDSNGGVTDIRGASLISIEGLTFKAVPGGGFMEAQLSADQFDNGELSSALLVRSDHVGTEQLRITMGSQTVFSAADFTFTGFGATESVQIEGSSGNDSITGSSVNDGLFGAAGQDVLLGGAGDDTLDGGAGNDFMFGGAGNDIYKVASAGDLAAEVLVGSDPGGKDKVIAEVDSTLTPFIENLDLGGAADLAGTGNALANIITGNGGANILSGLGGNDRLIGGLGQDQLFGGAGIDRFIFKSVADSAPGTTRDQIRDFSAGDKIDVALIDADATLAGNQAFALDQDGSFSIGEIRLAVSGANTIVSFNADTDGAVDMQITVIGFTGLTATDFIL